MIRRLGAIISTAILLAACSAPTEPVEIRFEPRFNGHPLSCADEVATVTLTDLRFYVHQVQLMAVDGTLVDLKLEEDRTWQSEDLALLDFENGDGFCLNGTAGMRSVLRGVIKPDTYFGLHFTLGVPFDRNHADPLQAAVPLGDPAMHWHWRSGYKFLRAGIRDADDNFWIHLGSTGCSGTVGHISDCSSPNRVSVQLNEFIPGRDIVVVDLAKLVGAGELDDGVPSDCSSGPAEVACAAPFEALGLDHTTGGPAGPQRLFKSRPPR